jgi:hypothetical protein
VTAFKAGEMAQIIPWKNVYTDKIVNYCGLVEVVKPISVGVYEVQILNGGSHHGCLIKITIMALRHI